jgi:hypothetical protein
MKTFDNKNRFRLAALLSYLFIGAAAPINAAAPVAGVRGEELAVWSVMAATVASDNADRPYKVWYFKSDFSTATFVALALDDPDRAEFCGLSGQDSQAMLEQLKNVGAAPVVLERSTAEFAGFRLARNKNPRLRYFALSRVVFNSAMNRAWLSVELNGERGSVVGLNKVDGEWQRSSRCGAWYMPEGSAAAEPSRIESRILGQRKR